MALVKFTNITEFLKKYNDGVFDTSDDKTMVAAGWCDWFCQTGRLKAKLDNFIPVIEAIAKCPAIDPQNTTLRFKEVAPATGGYIDGLRFQFADTGEGMFWCQVDEKGLAEVWDFMNSKGCKNTLPENDRSGTESIVRFFESLK